jgi:predicted nucleic acid-binding protein
MSRSPNFPSPLLLDACALINLYACGHAREILASSAMPCAIVSQVRHETLFIRRGGQGEDAGERIPIDLNDQLSQGLLQVVPEAIEDELNTFIDLAVELGDGEAMTAAIALHRGHTVVTDDRVALRVIGNRVPTKPSLQLIKDWIEREQISREVASRALLSLRQRGSYLPGTNHPLRSWWDDLFE